MFVRKKKIYKKQKQKFKKRCTTVAAITNRPVDRQIENDEWQKQKTESEESLVEKQTEAEMIL